MLSDELYEEQMKEAIRIPDLWSEMTKNHTDKRRAAVWLRNTSDSVYSQLKLRELEAEEQQRSGEFAEEAAAAYRRWRVNAYHFKTIVDAKRRTLEFEIREQQINYNKAKSALKRLTNAVLDLEEGIIQPEELFKALDTIKANEEETLREKFTDPDGDPDL